jgi:hypothetical protein
MHDLEHPTAAELHQAERELLGFLDEDLAEHIFSTDDVARLACERAGVTFP